MGNKKICRQHPFGIVDAFSKYLILLLLPLLRALMLLNGDVLAWAEGFWKDILAVAAIAIFGVLTWFRFTYELDDDRIRVEKGVFCSVKMELLYRNISTVTVETPWYLRLFRVSRLKLETDAGSIKQADIRILMTYQQAMDAAEKCTAHMRQDSAVLRTYRSKAIYVALLSLITSSTLSGVLFVATLISQTGKILGEEVEAQIVDSFTRLSRILIFWLPPAAAILACVILFGWFVAFLLNLINHLKFRAERQGKRIFVRAGLFSRRETYISAKKINYLLLRQGFFTRILGFFSAMLNCTGYGKGKNELSVIVPAADSKDLRHSLRMFLPEARIKKRGCKPPLASFNRFIFQPLSIGAVVWAGYLVFGHFFDQYENISLFLFVMAELPLLAWLLVRISGFFHNGITIGHAYIFRGTKGYMLFTVVIQPEKIAVAELRQTIFQKMTHCADLVIRPFSEQKGRFVITNLRAEDAEAFIQNWKERR